MGCPLVEGRLDFPLAEVHCYSKLQQPFASLDEEISSLKMWVVDEHSIVPIIIRIPPSWGKDE